MCGIVGYVGSRPVVDILLKGLKRLEYRGYDSAGIAFFHQGKLEVKKSEGKLQNVEKLLNGSAPLYQDARCGIGHTRWATHGKPTTQNAHPHRASHVVLVHNGIIENYQEIKAELMARGHLPESETDSELFGFLVLEEMERGHGLVEAVRLAFLKLEGACSVVVMSEREPGVVVGVRNGSPLVAAQDPQGGVILASDAQPILEYCKKVTFLENGDMVIGTEQGISFRDIGTGKPVERHLTELNWTADALDKGGYPHYMLKEIYEQPAALVDTLNGLLDRVKADAFSLAEQPGVRLLDQAKKIVLVACGTSWHAAQVGKYWIERWALMPVSVELASEFRYRDPVIETGTLVVGVSQSGETADTLAVIQEMKRRSVPTLCVTNVRGSTLAREADAVFFTSAGPEIGVAATKTFTTQLLMFLLWAGYLGLMRGTLGSTPAQSKQTIQMLFQGIVQIPHFLKDVLQEDSEMVRAVKAAAQNIQNVSGLFFIGRGFSFPIALEGALKVKEISYIHAEGYASGELKHGPIAMIDQGMAVIVLAPQDSWREKTLSNLQEVKARGARIVGVGSSKDLGFQSVCDDWIPVPALFYRTHQAPSALGGMHHLDESLSPFVMSPVIQLLSYELAVLRGTDVDKPRNLAKSVTVE